MDTAALVVKSGALGCNTFLRDKSRAPGEAKKLCKHKGDGKVNVRRNSKPIRLHAATPGLIQMIPWEDKFAVWTGARVSGALEGGIYPAVEFGHIFKRQHLCLFARPNNPFEVEVRQTAVLDARRRHGDARISKLQRGIYPAAAELAGGCGLKSALLERAVAPPGRWAL